MVMARSKEPDISVRLSTSSYIIMVLAISSKPQSALPKVASYLEELDLPAAGNVEAFDAAGAIRRADALMGDYDAVLARLREKSAQLSETAKENERLLLELLERTKP